MAALTTVATRSTRSPSGSAIPGPEGARTAASLTGSPSRMTKQGTVERESPASLGENRPDRPDFRAGGPVRHYSRSASPDQIQHK